MGSFVSGFSYLALCCFRFICVVWASGAFLFAAEWRSVVWRDRVFLKHKLVVGRWLVSIWGYYEECYCDCSHVLSFDLFGENSGANS